MEQNENPISESIKTRLKLVDDEFEEAWRWSRGGIHIQLDLYFGGAVGPTNRDDYRAKIESFAAITAKLVKHKAKSMIARALWELSYVDADENLQVDVKNFILTFFDYSAYAQRLPVFVDEVERKFSSWRKDYNPEELGLTKIGDSFQSHIKDAVRTAREMIDAEFTLLRTQPLEVREEADRPISNGLSEPYVVKKREMTEEGNIFRKEGDFWEVSFDGKAVRGIKHLAGMAYIEYLLDHPGREVPASEFIRTPPTSEEASRFGKMHEDQLEELNLSKSKSLKGGYKERISAQMLGKDRQIKEQFRKQIAALGEIINDKESLREEVSKAQKEKETLITELRAFHYKSNDNARTAVFMAITRAINHIRKHHESLAAHLKSHIHLGNYCIYNPPDNPDWNK